MKNKRWLSPYEKCDICGEQIKGVAEFFVDGKTEMGPWALMCPKCFEKYGIKIGYGVGQKYDGNTGELLAGDDNESKD